MRKKVQLLFAHNEVSDIIREYVRGLGYSMIRTVFRCSNDALAIAEVEVLESAEAEVGADARGGESGPDSYDPATFVGYDTPETRAALRKPFDDADAWLKAAKAAGSGPTVTVPEATLRKMDRDLQLLSAGVLHGPEAYRSVFRECISSIQGTIAMLLHEK